MTRFRRKHDKFHAPDILFREVKSVNILDDPDEPISKVIVQYIVLDENRQEKYLHVKMDRGLCMTMLVRGSDCLRVDIGLGPSGNYARWNGAYGS